jgi:hypothetical protein
MQAFQMETFDESNKLSCGPPLFLDSGPSPTFSFKRGGGGGGGGKKFNCRYPA